MTVIELMRGDMTYTAMVTGVTAVTSGNLLQAGENTNSVSSSGKSSLDIGAADIQVENLVTAGDGRVVA